MADVMERVESGEWGWKGTYLDTSICVFGVGEAHGHHAFGLFVVEDDVGDGPECFGFVADVLVEVEAENWLVLFELVSLRRFGSASGWDGDIPRAHPM